LEWGGGIDFHSISAFGTPELDAGDHHLLIPSGKRLWKLRLCHHRLGSGNGRDTKPSHLSSWSKVCKPLCEGRPRMRDLVVQIEAFQAKLLWRALKGRLPIWAQEVSA